MQRRLLATGAALVLTWRLGPVSRQHLPPAGQLSTSSAPPLPRYACQTVRSLRDHTAGSPAGGKTTKPVYPYLKTENQNPRSDRRRQIQSERENHLHLLFHVAGDALVVTAQTLLDQIKTDMNLGEGEVTMFVADMPNAPPQNVPVMIAQAGQAQSGDAKAMRTLGVCHPAPNELYSLENVFDPAADARSYLSNYEFKTVDRTSPATVTILQQPSHGVLRLVTEADRGTILNSEGGGVILHPRVRQFRHKNGVF